MIHRFTSKTCIAATHAVFFCLIATSAPSERVAAAPAAAEPADPEAATLLEELVAWVDDEPANEPGPPLGEVIRERPRSFELFRSYHDETDRRAQLASLPYGEAISRIAARHGVDGLLLVAVMEVESGFDPTAASHRGAIGLMQVLPSTAGETPEDLTDPEINLDAGARYLQRLLYRFDGDLELALAAYNAGPSAVRRYDGLPPFPETRRYVEKVLTRYISLHRDRWHAEPGELLALM